MSAAMALSTEHVVVHVRLLDEGVDAWRPVEAQRISQSTYRLSESAPPEDERWSFQPGDVVVAEPRRSEPGENDRLVAVARVSDFDPRSSIDYAQAG